MKKESDAEINMKIAKLLGFEFYRNHAGWDVQVVYPKEWSKFAYSCPTSHVPDFIGMIRRFSEFVSNNSIIPKTRAR